MLAVKYEDLQEAFDFVSSAAPMEHSAHISLDTGAIYWMSDVNPLEEEVPDDLETSNRYIAVPHKNDLDLGSHLALRFAAEEMPDRYAQIEGFFRHRGAYARFKQLLDAEGCLDRWHTFEAEATERALRNWCAENDIQVVESDDEPSA
jgi:hypothetical protein